jgi:endonuclease/exonuclease/phosphatase (EEP) superfamily protein YafD
MQWLLDALRDDDASAILGGDFNSWAGGADEPALRMPQAWGFVRGTPIRESTWKLRWLLGILDHVFYRLPPGAAVQTREIEAAYGSDHRPWLGWVRLDSNNVETNFESGASAGDLGLGALSVSVGDH